MSATSSKEPQYYKIEITEEETKFYILKSVEEGIRLSCILYIRFLTSMRH